MFEKMREKTTTAFGREGLPEGRQVPSRLDVVALTMMRVTVGLILTVHGGLKLANPEQTIQHFSLLQVPAPELAVYLAIAGELFGGLGLLIGLLTQISALGPLFTMGAAIGFVHLGNGLLSANHGWEYPLTLLVVAFYFVVRGGGPWSVDALLSSMRKTGRGAERRAPSESSSGDRANQSEPDEPPRQRRSTSSGSDAVSHGV